MPTKYKRKQSVSRGNWTEKQLRDAVDAINNNILGVNEACRQFGIPKATLLRRKASGNLSKTTSLGPSSTLGYENERKLVSHIKKLQKFGFAPSRNDVRCMAFALAEQLGLSHRFNKEEKKAGYDWLQLFLQRHCDLSVRTAEGISLARSTALCRETVNSYFRLVEEVFSENLLFDKPGHIFNVDETGLQLNNKPGQVIAAKGSKTVSSLTSAEKGETISVVACCNGEGSFLPPYCIFKGKNIKREFSNGMPPGSVVKMNQKSAYVNVEIFFDWFKHHFVPRKPAGKVVLILDGHTSHCNSCEMLEFANEHEIIMICLPAHTTHYLQPLDRSAFKSLKTHYYEAANNFVKRNPQQRISRLNFGSLLAEAWAKAATSNNAISGFRATGLIPFSPEAIPDYAFLAKEDAENLSANSFGQTSSVELEDTSIRMDDPQQEFLTIDNAPMPKEYVTVPQPSCSASAIQGLDDLTPGKRLDIIQPIPVIKKQIDSVKRRGRALAEVLTSPENIVKRKEREKVVQKKSKNATERKVMKKSKRKVTPRSSTSSDSTDLEEQEMFVDDSDSLDSWDANDCAGCGENYNLTRKSDEWIKCVICGRWLHESCMKYDNMCERCGKRSR